MLLSDCEVNIAHQYISLWVLEVTFLKVAADVIISDLRIVKFTCASLGFVKGKELKEAVSVLALGLFVLALWGCALSRTIVFPGVV